MRGSRANSIFFFLTIFALDVESCNFFSSVPPDSLSRPHTDRQHRAHPRVHRAFYSIKLEQRVRQAGERCIRQRAMLDVRVQAVREAALLQVSVKEHGEQYR